MGFQPPCLEGLTSLSPFRDATESGVQHCSECITHVRWVHELKPYRPPPTLAYVRLGYAARHGLFTALQDLGRHSIYREGVATCGYLVPPVGLEPTLDGF